MRKSAAETEKKTEQERRRQSEKALATKPNSILNEWTTQFVVGGRPVVVRPSIRPSAG